MRAEREATLRRLVSVTLECERRKRPFPESQKSIAEGQKNIAE